MSVTFTMLVGLPGSGKSTYARTLKEAYGEDVTVIIESDSYRERFYGDPAVQGDNNKLFEVIHSDVLEKLAEGTNVIFDATNISRKHRVALVQKLSNNVVKECIIVATSYPRCLERNEQRERKVPKEVVDRMWKSFQIPTYTEGWDIIDIEYDYDEDSYSIEDYLSFADNYDQMNYHHSLTLGGHSRKVAELVSENKVDEWVRLAALLHDVGKPLVQTIEHKDGVEIARYFNHSNIGSYESLFYLENKLIRINDILNSSCLINYHMDMYNIKSDTSINKLKNKVGNDNFYFLELLHKADVESK